MVFHFIYWDIVLVVTICRECGTGKNLNEVIKNKLASKDAYFGFNIFADVPVF